MHRGVSRRLFFLSVRLASAAVLLGTAALAHAQAAASNADVSEALAAKSVQAEASPPADVAATRLVSELEAENAELLAMATDLRKAVYQTRADVLSLEVIRTAASIEKLAQGVKEKYRKEAR